jgi:hypothetical protein
VRLSLLNGVLVSPFGVFIAKRIKNTPLSNQSGSSKLDQINTQLTGGTSWERS